MDPQAKKESKVLFNEILETIKTILNGKAIGGYKYVSKEFGIDFFDDESNFYSKHLNDMFDTSFPVNPIESLEHQINQRNLILLLEYFEYLNENNENIYKEPLIKLNLSLIIGFFTQRFGKKVIDTKEYFYICLKEIEKYYKFNKINIETTFDNFWRDKAKKLIDEYKEIKKKNISQLYYYVKVLYEKKRDLDEVAKLGRILREYNEDKKKLDMTQLESKYLTNQSYKKYIDYYLDDKCDYYTIDKELKKKELYQTMFFEDILNIDINNIEEVLFLIYILDKYKLCSSPVNYDEIYQEYKRSYENLSEDLKDDITEELKEILDNEEFFEKLLVILESNSVKNYFLKKRLFNENNDDIKFIENNDDDIFDDDLSSEYAKFITNMKKDKKWLRKLIIFKYLTKFKRAIVNPLMRIIVNPLYIEISDELKNDNKKRKIILEAYLTILLIHEIAHLLKFFKEDFSFQYIPSTPKLREGGEVFIKYLFGISKIKNIDYDQAIMVNDSSNWDSIHELHKIFNHEEDKNSIKSDKIETNNNINYYIKFYDTDIEGDNLQESNIEEKDDWCTF